MVDSVDNIDAAVSTIETKLGDAADVVSNQESAKNAVEPLESVKNISTYSVFAAVGTGAIIILLTMMMIVRERRREIGVMKAIGSTNGKTMLQFMSEAITLTLLGLIIGLIISVFVAQPITKVLVNNSSSSTSSRQVGLGQAFPGGGARMRGVPGALRGVQDVKSSVGADVLVYGLGVAFLIAIIGSALPAYLISKVSPAEAMRAE